MSLFAPWALILTTISRCGVESEAPIGSSSLSGETSQPCSVGLFTEPSKPAPGPFPEDRTVLRQRWVGVDLGRLSGDEPVALNLFPDACHLAIREGFEQTGPRSFVWTGRIGDGEGSQATFVAVEGVLAGSITAGGAFYNLRYSRDGIYLLAQVDQAAFPPENPPPPPGSEGEG